MEKDAYQIEIENLERLLRYGDKAQCLLAFQLMRNYPEIANDIDDATDIEYLESMFFPEIDGIQPTLEWCIQKITYVRDCSEERVMGNYFDDVLEWFHDQFGTPELAKERIEKLISEYY